MITNPVELSVEIFSRHLDRHKVLGMGAQQDSLRFARAIADVAGVHHDRVHAWVLGEQREVEGAGSGHPDQSGRVVWYNARR